MGEKVTFNATTRVITVTEAPDAEGEVYIDVKADLYSDGKEDWVATEALRKVIFPIEVTGGDNLPGEKALGTTYFLRSDWKIAPYEASHRMVINGNLYAVDGSDLFLDTAGSFIVRIMQQVSNLVDSTVQQLDDIQYASYNGGVTVDLNSSYTGTDHPVGTPREPVNNFEDALLIIERVGLPKKFFVVGDAVINNANDFTNYVFVGDSESKTTFTIMADATTIGCEFYDALVTGVLDGMNEIVNCIVKDLTYFNGKIYGCGLLGDIVLDGGADGVIGDCYTVDQDNPPAIDMGGSGQDLAMPNYSGLLTIKNFTGPTNDVGIGLAAGAIILDPTITAGNIIIGGSGLCEENYTSITSINLAGLNSPAGTANAVWGHESALRLLGLTQENYYLDNTVYSTHNGIKLLTSGRIRLYSDPASVGTTSDVIATYTVTSSWVADELQTYKVVKI